MTVRWQQELPRGHGYLSVVFGVVGLALLAAATLAELKVRARDGRVWSAAVVGSTTLILLIAVSIGITAAVNMSIVA